MIRTRKLSEQEARMYAELISIKEILGNFPTGIVSYVSDTYDLWKVCSEILPLIKNEILSRDGKLVIRPDSGDPVDIICGRKVYNNIFDSLDNKDGVIYENGEYISYKEDNLGNYEKDKVYSPNEMLGVVQLLWNVFGGTINEQGYKVLDPHIGVIYGDSITLDRAERICQRLADKGFASTNVVLGIGSYTYNYNTRDTLGIAVKSTYCEVDGEEREIFKDPVTDDGTKKSLKGLLRVNKIDGEFMVIDQVTKAEEAGGELKTVYKDGRLVRDFSLSEIRERLKNGN